MAHVRDRSQSLQGTLVKWLQASYLHPLPAREEPSSGQVFLALDAPAPPVRLAPGSSLCFPQARECPPPPPQQRQTQRGEWRQHGLKQDWDLHTAVPQVVLTCTWHSEPLRGTIPRNKSPACPITLPLAEQLTLCKGAKRGAVELGGAPDGSRTQCVGLKRTRIPSSCPTDDIAAGRLTKHMAVLLRNWRAQITWPKGRSQNYS